MAPRNKSSTSTASVDDAASGDSSSDAISENSSGRNRSKKYSSVDKNSDEYRRRRERNNIAVKKSRTKSKMKTQQTLERVNQLRAENEMLETKIKLLTKELSFLKDLFMAHAGSAHGQHLTEVDLNFLSEDQEKESGIANNQAIENDHKYSSQDSDLSVET